MKCAYCDTGFVDSDFEPSYIYQDPVKKDFGYQISHGECPECENMLVILYSGKIQKTKEDKHNSFEFIGEEHCEFIFPKTTNKKINNDVPEPYKTDFLESASVLNISPKASAALSRRLLQKILNEEFKLKEKSLAAEIDLFLKLPNIPSYLTDAVDAIRNIGNYAAHPTKDKHTGEIVDVEPGEADWLLEVLESLFDFVFVQPKRLQKRKKELNNKLKALGKPEMKTSNP